MAVIEQIVERLQHVRNNAKGRYMACCPSHEDRSPSLQITEQPNGRVLIHCFAGCGGADVMEAIGMSLKDLYPEGELDHHIPGFKRKTDSTIDELVLEIGDGWRKNGKHQTEAHKQEELAAWLRQQRAG